MRSRFLGRTGLVLVALLLLWTEMAAAFSYHDISPQGKIGLSQPTLSQKLNLEPGERIIAAELWLDGHLVQASWDESGLISYRPSRPLEPGTHSGKLVVRVAPSRPGYFYAPVESLFTFTVVEGARGSLPEPGAEELRALEVVNRYRRLAGLSSLTYDQRLAAAAHSHAEYLAKNPGQLSADGHREVPGRPGFTGETNGDRARYFTYSGGTAEVINFVQRAEDAVAGWIDTPYHRIPLLHPGMTALGYGLAAGGGQQIEIVQVGPYTRSPAVVQWPYSGQTDVPPLWDGQETPSPFDLYPGTALPVGYPITLIFGDRPKGLRLTSWSLTGPEGEVELLPFDPRRDPTLEDTVAVIPKRPLRSGTRYTVSLRGEADFGEGLRPYEHTWSFQTAAGYRPQLKAQGVTFSSPGQEVRSIRLDGVGLGQELQIYLGGLPVEGLIRHSDSQVSFRPPVGYRGERADLLVVTRDGHEAVWPNFFTGSESYRWPAGSAFTQLPLVVKGQRLSAPALLHREGTVLLPAGALQTLGGLPEQVTAIDRTYWSLGGQTGEYALGRVSASLGGRELRLALPVQERLGQTYLDATVARRLAGAEQQVVAGALYLGRRIVGQIDIDGHWALPAIQRLLMGGLVSGMGDGSFRPDESLSRAAFVKMLVGAVNASAAAGSSMDSGGETRADRWPDTPSPGALLLGLSPLKPGDTAGFTDTRGHWVAEQGYLAAAVAAGIIRPTEYAYGRFEPDRAITREEMAVMVVRALGLEGQALSTSLTISGGAAVIDGRIFGDAAGWSRPQYVAGAVRAGIITGYAEGNGRYTFRPSQTATRAEAAVMVTRALDFKR